VEDNMKEFVAYSKMLLRALLRLKELLDNDQIDDAKKVLNEIIEDVKGDIEA